MAFVKTKKANEIEIIDEINNKTYIVYEPNKNMCVNSVFNGITITIDMIEKNPEKIRLLALRSFGESLYHSITDASLEFGYKTETIK